VHVGGDNCPTDTCTYGFKDVEGVFEVSASLKTPFYDFEYKFEDKATFIKDLPKGSCL
jgi:hypothetical protein